MYVLTPVHGGECHTVTDDGEPTIHACNYMCICSAECTDFRGGQQNVEYKDELTEWLWSNSPFYALVHHVQELLNRTSDPHTSSFSNLGDIQTHMTD